MMSENIKIYKKTEEGYPKTLLQLPDAPSRLYVLGELPDPMRPAIAIVGARNCSSYGKNMAYEYARILTQTGIQVISGLARGVDAAAHAGALAAGGKTYGVMGCGVDFCYPTSSRKLYHVMQQQGDILSEFAPGTPPLSYHFPLRNRIISGPGILFLPILLHSPAPVFSAPETFFLLFLKIFVPDSILPPVVPAVAKAAPLFCVLFCEAAWLYILPVFSPGTLHTDAPVSTAVYHRFPSAVLP